MSEHKTELEMLDELIESINRLNKPDVKIPEKQPDNTGNAVQPIPLPPFIPAETEQKPVKK